jgi:hypothetical protein
MVVYRPASGGGLRPTRCGAWLLGVTSPSVCAPATQRCLERSVGMAKGFTVSLEKCPKNMENLVGFGEFMA